MNKPTSPIIRIEVETLKHVILHAFGEQMLNLDEQFQIALNDACQPEKIQSIFTTAANQYIKEAIQNETKNYFLYGEGRKHIKDVIKKRLDLETF